MQLKDHIPVAYARRLAHSIGRYLKDRYGATKVLLFGSLTLGAYNPDFSDIDVYFEGVREELVASAMATAAATSASATSSDANVLTTSRPNTSHPSCAPASARSARRSNPLQFNKNNIPHIHNASPATEGRREKEVMPQDQDTSSKDQATGRAPKARPVFFSGGLGKGQRDPAHGGAIFSRLSYGQVAD